MIVPFQVELERLVEPAPQTGIWLRDRALEVIGEYSAVRVSVADADHDTDGPIDAEALRLAREDECRLEATPDLLLLPGWATFERNTPGPAPDSYQQLRERLLAGLPEPTRFTINTRALAELAVALDAEDGLLEIELRAPNAVLVITPITREHTDTGPDTGAADPDCEALVMPSPASAWQDDPRNDAEAGAADGWRAGVDAAIIRLLQGSCDRYAIERWLQRPRRRLLDRSPGQLLDEASGRDDPRVQAVLELASTLAGPRRATLAAGAARQIARRSWQLAETLATTGGPSAEQTAEARAIVRDAAASDWGHQYSSRPALDAHDAITNLDQAIETGSSDQLRSALRQLTAIADRHAAVPLGIYAGAW